MEITADLVIDVIPTNRRRVLDIKYTAMKRVVLGGEAAILLLVFLMGMLGLKNISVMHAGMENVVNVQAKKTQLVASMRSAVRTRMMHLLRMTIESDPFERDAELQSFYEVAGIYRTAYLEYVSYKLTEEEDRLSHEAAAIARASQQKARDWAEMIHLGSGPESGLKELQSEVEQGQVALLNKLGQLAWLQKQVLDDAENEMDIVLDDMTAAYMLIVLLVICLIVIISYLIIKYIQRSHMTLIEKNRALEHATEVKSRFLATMSHEIRTPMNGVMGIASLLGQTSLDSQQREYIELIESSGDRLLLLINDILDFSKIEAGHMIAASTVFSFNNLVYECVDIMQAAAQKKGLELVLDLAPETHRMVQSDPARLRQVLTNLLSNAIKFTRRGAVLVSATSIGEDRIKLAVEDTGEGIPEAFQDRVFQPFSQAQDGSSRNYGGTGLGLAISHDLVRVLGGEMGFDSTVGVGTVFWCDIPVGAPSEQIAQHDSKHKRILLLDDLDISRQALSHALEYLGYQVTLAMNTNNAMDILFAAQRSGHCYDYFFVDQGLSGVDGQEFARVVRRTDGLQKVETILMVSKGAAVMQADDVIGVEAILVKPFKYESICELLTGTKDRSKSEDVNMADKKAVLPARDESSAGYMLIAEDNPVNQKVIVGMLQKLGYAVRVTENGKQALEAARQERFDLIFMDCQMPVMDGYEATAELKSLMQNEVIAVTPIIAITANALVGDREKCLAAGMDDFMSKPIKLQDLQEMADRWLKQNKSIRQSIA